jgi:predicted RNase H-like HicB family nuclease
MAHDGTHEALLNIKSAMELWIKTAGEFNDSIPAPKGRRLAFA